MTVLGVSLSLYINDHHTALGSGNSGDIGWLTVAQFTFLAICMLLAWWSAPAAHTLTDVRLLLLVAVIARLLCIPAGHYTSTDMDRYLFDGKVALSGYDPYQVNHNAQDLQALKAQWKPPEEHAKYPTLYPPLALATFALAATTDVRHAGLTWKLIVTGFGIGTVFILAALLKRIGHLRHLSLAALSPLLILETGIGAHVDALSTFFVAAALYLYHERKLALSGIFIGLGALTKLLPIMLAIPLCLGQKRLKDSIAIGGALSATIILGYGTTLALGFVPVGSIGTLFEKWRFGSPVYQFLEFSLAGHYPALLAASCVIVSLSVLAYRAWRLEQAISITHPLLPLSMALILVFSPVVFPWYMMALIPLVVIAPRPFLLTWMCTLPATYEVLSGYYIDSVWLPANWPLILIFLGFVCSLFLEWRTTQDKSATRSNALASMTAKGNN